MATPVRCSLLALVCLAFLRLLACAPTAKDLLVRCPMDTATLPPHASVLPRGPDEPTTPTGCCDVCGWRSSLVTRNSQARTAAATLLLHRNR